MQIIEEMKFISFIMDILFGISLKNSKVDSYLFKISTFYVMIYSDENNMYLNKEVYNMIILLTNDDGIYSEKIQYAKKILSKYGTVYTVAPSVQQSGKGMALTIGGFQFQKIDEFNYSVEGTPVDCVNYSLGGLHLRPDIIVSGINNGYNLGFDTKYSGTLGACFQGQYFGLKTIAFSSDFKGIKMVEAEFEKTFKYVLDNDLLSDKYTLNVNFPREIEKVSKGIKTTKLFYQKYTYDPDITENKYVANRKILRTEDLPVDADAYAIRHGYTSISKLSNL